MADIANPGVTGGSPVVLPLEVEAYLTHLSVERGRSEKTVSAYRGDLRRFAEFVADRDAELCSATAGDLAAWSLQLRSSGLAASSVARKLVSVRGLYRHLVAEGKIDSDPTRTVELPGQPDALPKALSVHSVATMLDLVGESAAEGDPLAQRDSALLEFLYGTGSRVSEACGLGFGDLDLDTGLARVLGKRDKERMVPIARPVSAALALWLDAGRPSLLSDRASRKDRDAVFLGARGRRLSRQAAWTAIRLRAHEAGITEEISPHVLRHSCATHMLEGGADIRTVAELLGHASVSTTQIYTRVATESLFESYRCAHPRAVPAGSAGTARP